MESENCDKLFALCKAVIVLGSQAWIPMDEKYQTYI